jgi:hypothetical protein
MKICTCCKKIKPLENFYWRNKSKKQKHSYCSLCQNERSKRNYLSNVEKYKTKAKKAAKKARDFVNDIKSNSSCFDCGISYPNEPWLFDFDHTKDKIDCVSVLVSTKSKETVLQEIEKCDLVCLICHRRRTANRAGWIYI